MEVTTMKKYSIKQCIKLLEEEKLSSDAIYENVKKTFQKVGAQIDPIHIKKEKDQKETIKNTWYTFDFHEDIEVRPQKLFLTNLYIHDDAQFANLVEEALSAGIDPHNTEHILLYLNAQGYKMPESIYNFKLAEFTLYKKFYEKTDIWYMVKDILQKTGLSEATIDELKEYKQKEVGNKERMVSQYPTKDLQKIKAFPNGFEEKAS